MSHSGDDTMFEIEQRALFASDEGGRHMPKTDAFEILEAAGIGEIDWDEELNAEFSNWRYINIK